MFQFNRKLEDDMILLKVMNKIDYQKYVKVEKVNFKVNAARKSKVDDNTARMQSIKQLGV